MNKEVLIIGNDHYHTLWLIRSYGMAGYKPSCIVVGCASQKSFVEKSRYLDKCFFVETIDEIPDFLLQLSFAERVVVEASGDPVAEILDKNYDVLSSKYILHNCNNKQGQVLYWMDKKNMLKKAEECGLAIPHTLSLNLNENVDLSNVTYPCLLKPELSAESSKNSFRICNDEKELQTAVESLESELSSVIVQDYINRDYEFLIYGVSTKEEVFMPGGLRKLYTCSSENNLGMMTFGYVSSEIPEQIGNFEKITKFVREIGYLGLFSIEFMITKDKAYFLEINLRNDGTCYITTQAGINLPAIWAASCYHENPKLLGRNFIRKRTYGMNEINYLKYSLRELGVVQSIKNVCKTSAFSLFMKEDIKPFAYKFIYHHG